MEPRPRITTPLGDEPLAIYRLLEKAKPAERSDLVLDYITRHGRLELPERDGLQARLAKIDLSRETLQVRLEQIPEGMALWWTKGFGGANLEMANLQGANLLLSNLQGVRLEAANLQGTVLVAANLQGANLVAANLQGAYLVDAYLQGADLEKANLWRADLEKANLQGAHLMDVNLQGADLRRANLQGADLRRANLQGADLMRANFQGADLAAADLQRADLWGADLQGADLSRARLEGVDLTSCVSLAHIKVWRAYLDRTQLRREQLGEAIGEELAARASRAKAVARAELYADAKQGYLGLKQNFENLGDYDAASWAYRKEREMERLEGGWRARHAWRPTPTLEQAPPYNPQHRKAARHAAKWVSDTMQWLLTDYGESGWRVFGGIILVFLLFAAFYGAINGVRLVDSGALTHDPKDLLLFSLGAMTTVLPINLQPACDGAQVLVNLETLLAVALTGLLGFVLGNRIRHS